MSKDPVFHSIKVARAKGLGGEEMSPEEQCGGERREHTSSTGEME
jgi:hypothetical protein